MGGVRGVAVGVLAARSDGGRQKVSGTGCFFGGAVGVGGGSHGCRGLEVLGAVERVASEGSL